MDNKELLYKKLNALRLEVHGSIVDDIKSTVDDLFQEQLLQQTACNTLLLDKLQQMIKDIELAGKTYPRMWTGDVIRLLNKVQEIAQQ